MSNYDPSTVEKVAWRLFSESYTQRFGESRVRVPEWAGIVTPVMVRAFLVGVLLSSLTMLGVGIFRGYLTAYTLFSVASRAVDAAIPPHVLNAGAVLAAIAVEGTVFFAAVFLSIAAGWLSPERFTGQMVGDTIQQMGRMGVTFSVIIALNMGMAHVAARFQGSWVNALFVLLNVVFELAITIAVYFAGKAVGVVVAGAYYAPVVAERMEEALRLEAWKRERDVWMRKARKTLRLGLQPTSEDDGGKRAGGKALPAATTQARSYGSGSLSGAVREFATRYLEEHGAWPDARTVAEAIGVPEDKLPRVREALSRAKRKTSLAQ